METRSVLSSGLGGKDMVIIASREELAVPSKVVLPEPEPAPGLILPDGSINWGCPCLGGMATGPCGTQFRDAFSCFHYRYSSQGYIKKVILHNHDIFYMLSVYQCFLKHYFITALSLLDLNDHKNNSQYNTYYYKVVVLIVHFDILSVESGVMGGIHLSKGTTTPGSAVSMSDP